MGKSKFEPEPFESAGGYYLKSGKVRKDTSANIYESMLRSEAFMTLTSRQKVLYLYCKAQFFGKRKPGKDHPEVDEFQGDEAFYLNLKMAVDEYGLYPEGSAKNFYQDMAALIDHGLIVRISSGFRRREKSVYRFSTAWKEWKVSE